MTRREQADVIALREDLRRHAYRMTGSLIDAEVITARTLERAGADAGAPVSAGPVEVRARRVDLLIAATGYALEVLDARDQRAILIDQQAMPEPIWLDPYPADRSEQGTLALGFVTALQQLPVRERLALVLRDVANVEVADVAKALETTNLSVEHLARRARWQLEDFELDDVLSATDVEHEAVARRFLTALAAGDARAMSGVLHPDAVYIAPSASLTIRGAGGIMARLGEMTGGHLSSVRTIELALNGRLGAAVYQARQVPPGRQRDWPDPARQQPARQELYDDGPTSRSATALGLVHLDVSGGSVSRITFFGERLFGVLGLPRRVD